MGVDSMSGRLAQPRSASSTYLMSWVAMAAFGLGYIGVAATRPDLLGSILPVAEPAAEQAANARLAADVADEVAVLRKQVHDLQHEVAATRSALQEQISVTTGAITQRLAAAEERLPTVREIKIEPIKIEPPPALAPPAAPAPPPAKAAVQRLQTKASPPAQPAATPERQPRAAAADGAAPAKPNVRVINGPAEEAQIATGSILDAAAKSTPAAAAAPAGPRAIEIANSDTLEGLRARWGELSGRNGDVLGATTPRYRLSADGRGAPFTLLAGPYETSAEATRACNALRAKGVACRVGAYAGNAF